MENYRQAALAVIYNDENKFLVGNRARDGGVKFPQGGIDPGENSIDAIKREIMEEIGVELLDSDIEEEFEEKVTYSSKKLKVDYPEFDGQECIVFKIKYRENMNPTPHDEEFSNLFWMSYDEIEDSDMKGRKEAYKKAVEMCGLNK